MRLRNKVIISVARFYYKELNTVNNKVPTSVKPKMQLTWLDPINICLPLF